MKVKVSHTINLDEVPNHASRLLTQAGFWLEQLDTSMICRMITAEDLEDALRELARCRQAATDADLRFSEVEDLLMGYADIMAQIAEPIHYTPEEPEQLELFPDDN